MLPIGVIIPTKNSMAYLPRHVEGMRRWLDLAAEVVVVDSHSSDGTVEFLRANMRHPALRFTSHPPGLYACWNHGIAQIGSEYVYIATTGDTITREGMCKLVDAAKSLGCDVTLSPPSFCDPAGRPLPAPEWPIADLLATLGVTQPRRLHKIEAMIFAAVHASDALTGSSASDLFRTQVLQRHPFPTDFGTAGDAAWGLMHAAEVVWGVLPDTFSTFLVHPTNASTAERRVFQAARRADQVLRAAMDSWRQSGVVSEEDYVRARWGELMVLLTSYLDAKAAFDEDRRASVPWFLNPRAWRNRMQREQAAGRMRRLKRDVLRVCSPPAA